MYTRIEKPKENNSRAVANSVGQKKGISEQGVGFIDNRPKSIMQKKSQEIVNASPQVKQDTQLKTLSVNRLNLIQRAKVGERELGITEVPRDYTPSETKYDSLSATSDKGLFHQHIFFEDGEDPTDIGFHDKGLFSEPRMEGAYNWSISNLNDGKMRESVLHVGNPGTYSLLGNNCQAYVTKVINEYNRVNGYNNQGPSKKEHQEKAKMGYSLLPTE